MEKIDDYYVYILRCKDNSLYTGITKNLEKRYMEHAEGRGAKYTRARGVKKLELSFLCSGRSSASRIEYFIKKQNKSWKEHVIKEFSMLEEIVEKELEIKIKKIIDTF
ncbi:hypothetical protein IX317_001974 [Fusobacterium sp. DD29]|uniref:GIY-YIG nuclease family protein n=1 Tax=unclassified Fusobacterium TaxID=2648384 RepID=UPI001B8CE289|nr:MULTISPECIES: GIY-YIG nuclease family protein [unclassified Fusobacterium]MBR8702288.1 hypothetical protein [Fusobacterium sp. DD45]MBR8712105.1 hypothetical protein [Fusobacterium sp. DD28]MBR8750277.1 hypothetical protein [Fusobacterium sp. DD29]MBR8752683.1 hypothetical protein [Fusobacterium sp. DD26]MBR8762525.1 hypothetical protein [Fusobacterium sp. DD25]